MVKNINSSGDSSTDRFTLAGNTIYFTADDGTNGIELWKTDGTDAGTVMVKDIEPWDMPGWSNADYLTAFGNKLYFWGAGGLWESDGSTAGTVLVKDTMVKNINPAGTSDPYNFVAVGNAIYFYATDGASGFELWKTDGTGAGTVLVKDLNPGAGNGVN